MSFTLCMSFGTDSVRPAGTAAAMFSQNLCYVLSTLWTKAGGDRDSVNGVKQRCTDNIITGLFANI